MQQLFDVEFAAGVGLRHGREYPPGTLLTRRSVGAHHITPAFHISGALKIQNS
jgi:hypothetical protein